MCVSLTGCTGFFSNPVSLMSPPKSSGDLVEIEEAISKIAPDYNLSYPSAGRHRNAIVIRDLNNDGNNEALVFYEITENNIITVHMNLLVYSEKEWQSVIDLIERKHSEVGVSMDFDSGFVESFTYVFGKCCDNVYICFNTGE